VSLFVGATYHPITPVRVLDSRGPVGGWGSKVNYTSPRTLAIAGSNGVPATASAVVMNVTATESTMESYLTVYPKGTAKPNASNLNFAAGQIVPNLVTVKLGVAGSVEIATSNGSTHVVADVVGYYDDGTTASGATFTPITPRRLLDSRGPNGAWNGKLAAGSARDLVVRAPGRAEGVPADATAVVANVTITQPDSESFLSVWPSGLGQPNVSNLNFVPGQTRPNLVVVGIGPNGAVRLANTVGAVHVVVDVVGYFSPGVGARFFPVDPTRVLDSRFGTGLTGPWSAGESRPLVIGGRAGTNVPLAATAVVANVTAVEGTAESLVTMYPADVARPTASNLNFTVGQIVPNLATVGLSATGSARFYNDQGTVDIVADVVGFYALG
jgi:hypothetical protein